MIRPALVLLVLMLALSGCASVGGTPSASAERAAAFAARGDHEAAAREYTALALITRGSSVITRNDSRLLAVEQWLLANRIDAARNLFAAIEQPLDERQTTRRDLLVIEADLLSGKTAEAWQQIAARTEPTEPALLERHHALRQRVALAAQRPLEAVRSERARESVAGNDTQRLAALREELLGQLREASARGVRLDPRSAARDSLARGWLEAAPLAARAAALPASANRGITAAWQRRYPQHPATTALLATSATALQAAREQAVRERAARERAESRTESPSAPTPTPASPRGSTKGHVAALLPLSGRLAPAGEEIREGLLAAYFSQPELATRPLRFYDSAARPIGQIITEAIDQGAEFIVGPLLREEVMAAATLERRVPMLALNSTAESVSTGGAPLYQFALAPEDEARAAAHRALAEGRRRAVTFVPAGEWGERVLQAFRSTFEAGGGRILASAALSGNDFTAGIDSALRIDDSRARHRRLQSVLNQPLAFQPRRRGDVDLLFAPGQTGFIETLRLQLKFQGAADLPTFSTADAWDGEAAPELEGLIFPDLPWRISPESGASIALRSVLADAARTAIPRGRLFAFGHDAWLLQDALRRGESNLNIDGVTGRLSLGADRRILRSMQFVDIHDGLPRLLPEL